MFAPRGHEPRAHDDCAPLVARVAAGEKKALQEIYARFSSPLLHYLLTLAPDRRVAEEILQDTFVAVWRGAQTFAGRSSARTWIFGIARRQASNTLRRRGLPLHDGYEIDVLPLREQAPEEALLAGTVREEIAAQIRRLSPIHREVIDLVFYHGLSYAEVSEVLEVPVGTVKSRLSTAKRALRVFLTASGMVDR